MPTRVTLTAEQARAILQSPGYSLGPDQFTYSIPGARSIWPGYSDDGEPFRPGYAPPTHALASTYKADIGLWDSLIAPSFTRVADNANTRGELRIAFTDLTYLAGTYYGRPDYPWTKSGDTWFNADYHDDPFARGSYTYQSVLAALQIGFGLVRDGRNAAALPVEYDSRRFTLTASPAPFETLLTFTEDGGTLERHDDTVQAITPMVLDIAAAQVIYGADPNTRADDTAYRFKQGAVGLQSLYDAGGTDTIDVSNFTRACVVDLTPGGYSSLGVWTKAEQIVYWQAVYPGHDAEITAAFNGTHYEFRDNLGLALSTTIENAVGGRGNDVLYGNDLANRLDGGIGDDQVAAGLGDDMVIGGLGDDALDGGAGIDTASYAGAGSGVYVALYLQGGTQYTGGAGTDTLSGFENLIGSAHDDELSGDGADNVLEGGAGNDTLNGAAGFDTATYASAAAGITLSLGTDAAQDTGGAGVDRVYNVDAVIGSAFGDTLTAALFTGSRLAGGGGDDRLTGGLADDVLDGGKGADVLAGGWGLDAMTGGAGADRFVFTPGSTGSTIETADGILDFSRRDRDAIDLSAIDADAGADGVQHFQFVGTAAFSHVAGELRFSPRSGGALVEGDTDGDGTADLAIAVDGGASLARRDFILAPGDAGPMEWDGPPSRLLHEDLAPLAHLA